MRNAFSFSRKKRTTDGKVVTYSPFPIKFMGEAAVARRRQFSPFPVFQLCVFAKNFYVFPRIARIYFLWEIIFYNILYFILRNGTMSSRTSPSAMRTSASSPTTALIAGESVRQIKLKIDKFIKFQMPCSTMSLFNKKKCTP